MPSRLSVLIFSLGFIGAIACANQSGAQAPGSSFSFPKSGDKPVFVQIRHVWTSLKGKEGGVHVLGQGIVIGKPDTTGFRCERVEAQRKVTFSKEEVDGVLRGSIREPSGGELKRDMLVITGILTPEGTPAPIADVDSRVIELALKYLKEKELTLSEKEVLSRGLTPLVPDRIDFDLRIKIRCQGIFACTEDHAVPYEGFGEEWIGSIDYRGSSFSYSIKITNSVGNERVIGPRESSIRKVILTDFVGIFEVELDKLLLYWVGPKKFSDPRFRAITEPKIRVDNLEGGVRGY